MGWNSPWLSYLFVGGTPELDRFSAVDVYMPNGGLSHFSFLEGQNVTIDYYTNCKLKANYDGINVTNFELTYPNGVRLVYDFLRTNISNNWQYAFLGKKYDENGYVTQFIYDTEEHPYDPVDQIVRLWQVKDADSQVCTLQYDDPNYPNLVTSVTAPFGRSATLIYDSDGELIQINDAVGMASTIEYDVYTFWPTSLTTPYGTTTFSSAFHDVGSPERTLVITEPNNGRQVFACYSHCNWITETYPTPNAPLGTPDVSLDTNNAARNTFYWDQHQSENLPADFANFTPSDFLKARMRHWLSQNDSYGSVEGTLCFEQAPSPDGVTLGQITWYDYADKPDSATHGSQILPAVISRLLPGSTWYEAYERNSFGRPTIITNTYGPTNSVSTRTYTYDYATNDIDLTAVYGPTNELLAAYTYNDYHQVLTATLYADSQTPYTTTNTYDTNRLLTRIDFPTTLTRTFTYNASNYLSQVSDQPVSRSESFTWQDGQVLTHTDARNLTLTYSWDVLGRLTNVYYPDSTSIQYTYVLEPGQGFNNTLTNIPILEVTGVKDRLNHWTSIGYDRLRRVSYVIDRCTNTTYYEYCGCGSPSAVTDPLGNTTYFSYNNAGWRTNVLYPSNTFEYYGYNSLGQLTSRTNSLGVRTYTYNNQGLLTTISNNAGLEQGIGYDINDNPVTATNASGVVVSQTFDQLGRLETRTYPDTDPEEFAYSARGLTSYTSANGKLTQYGYDEAGRKTSETTPKNELITFGYNAGGDLLSLTDHLGRVTTWTYDTEGRVLTKQYEGQSFTNLVYHYDANGRLDWRRFYSGTNTYTSTSYTHDYNGNLTHIDYPSSPDVTFMYDAMNRLTYMVDASGTNQFTYTKDGDPESEDGPWPWDRVTYGYHTSVPHLRTSLTLQQPAGSWTENYTNDASGRLETISSPAGIFTYAFKKAGMTWTNLMLPTFSAITNAFDAAGRLTGTWLRNSGGSVLNKHLYLYDNNWRYRQTRYDNSYVTYGYDNDSQLQSAVGSGGQSTENLGYTYDGAWNMTQRTNSGVRTTYAVNDLNQVTGDGTYTYSYDANGNRTNQVGAGDLLTFTYDDENQLNSVVCSNLFKTEFVYDGKGRLRRRLEYTWSEEGSGSLTSLVSAVTYFGIVRSNFTGWVGFQVPVG
ncbi:MAG: hypothetical protein M1608_16850, partial [Candidatus Omnitrophica bacterium]|nr:hypothetical protein [Candidatus Omnitrophota bacterium]